MSSDKNELKDKKLQLSIVVPIYREESNIVPFMNRLEPVLKKMGVFHEIIFCLDPSPDRTEEVILEQIERNPNIKLIVFSRRFGQPAAVMAGVLTCLGEACVVIDVDLQDPPELIEEMYNKIKEGYEVVLAKRRSKQGEVWTRKLITKMGYRLLAKLSDVPIPVDTGEYRIISRRVIEELRRMNEIHGFLRGLVAYIGFKQAYVEFDRDKRYSGRTKYNRFFGSLNIGFDGIVGFSRKPLQLMSWIGLLCSSISFLLGGWIVVQKIWDPLEVHIIAGLSLTTLSITFFAGVQLLALGLIGEYLGRVYDQVKQRPMFIIDRKINY